MILVVCALPQELVGYALAPSVKVISVGVGPVDSAIATARELTAASLHNRPYSYVINAGIAGVFRGRGTIGDAKLVSTETLADFGLEGGAPLSLPGGATLTERIEANPRALRRLATLGLPRAVGLTVAQITTTDATAARYRTRYDADVESMEGFSVLRAAADAGIPAVEVRGISNYVGDRERSEWDFGSGARATVRALEAIVSILSNEE